MSRPKILLFVTNFHAGGTERQVVNLAAGLRGTEFDVQLACFRRDGVLQTEVADLPAVAEFPIRRLWQPATARQVARLALFVRRSGIDLVHSYGFYPNVFAMPAARLAGVPGVAAIRDTGDHLSPRRRQVQRWACGLADHVVVNAEAVRSRLVKDGYHAGRIEVIPNGIVLDTFHGKTDREGLRRRLGLPDTAPVVALFSRLVPLKGIEYFLAAAEKVKQRFPEARFLIVGDGSPAERVDGVPYRAVLENEAVRRGLEGRALFLGFRRDVADLLSIATVSVLPSLSEGLSNTVLEGMAAGLPVVATAVGGTPEAIRPGVTGFLVPPRDADALASAVCRVLDDPALARRLGEAGRRRAISEFSLAAMIDRTARMYRRVLSLPAAMPAAEGSTRAGASAS